jgi:hypothetical protein
MISVAEMGALARSEPKPRPLNGSNLLPRGLDRRVGRRLRQVKRVLAAADDKPVTTRQFMEAVYIHGEPCAMWRWAKVRLSARRYAKPALPRSRPLHWIAK